MEYFDMRKMSVNLWRNAAGETREICTFHRQNVIFTGVRKHCIHRGEWGVFFVSRYGKDSDVAGKGGEMFLESADHFTHTVKTVTAFCLCGGPGGKSETDGRADVDGFQYYDAPGCL